MFFFSSRRRHTRYWRDWSSDVCSSDLSEGACDRGRAELAGGVSRRATRVLGERVPTGCRPLAGAPRRCALDRGDRKSVVEGKSGDLGGRRLIKKKKMTI